MHSEDPLNASQAHPFVQGGEHLSVGGFAVGDRLGVRVEAAATVPAQIGLGLVLGLAILYRLHALACWTLRHNPLLSPPLSHYLRLVQTFVATQPRLQIAYLPPYAPELNPVELLWAYVKRNVLATFAAKDLRDLKRRWTQGFAVVRRRHPVPAFFRHTPLDFHQHQYGLQVQRHSVNQQVPFDVCP